MQDVPRHESLRPWLLRCLPGRQSWDWNPSGESWRALAEFEGVTLPVWAVYRQDDNGVRTRVAVFTGYRKARAAVTKLEAGKHKQTYWVEQGPLAE